MSLGFGAGYYRRFVASNGLELVLGSFAAIYPGLDAIFIGGVGCTIKIP